MNRLARLFGRKPLLTPKQQQRLQHWRDLPAPDSDCRDGSIRCIVVDVESTGPDLSRDRLIAIGALAVVDGSIAPNDAFAVTLRQARPSNAENILIHGIGAGEQCAGADPAEAMLGFLDYAGKSPLFAHHAFFDKAMIERALRQFLGAHLRSQWIDLAWMLPELFREKIDRKATLDEWLAVFDIGSIQRHNALSDAFATAQLLQIALRRAAVSGARSPNQLEEIELRCRHRFGWITAPGMPSERRPGQS